MLVAGGAVLSCDAGEVADVLGEQHVVTGRGGGEHLEKSGYTPGSSVLVEELADGELRIIPTDRVRERIRDVGRRVVAEHPEALEILADHDPDGDSPDA